MGKVLGLDLGTSSIGWAIVERNDAETTLLEKGVSIFQEGVAREKGNEKPAVQDRTQARLARRHYFRRRLRKIELLKVLVKEGFCPPLSDEQLQDWRSKKVYPLTEAFMAWQRTDDGTDKNPYHDRYRALNEKLDFGKESDRYAFGRALYHLVQRRGFLSNRKDVGKEDESGKVKSSINGLSEKIKAAGCTYLGEYFYKLYKDNLFNTNKKEKIRCNYTARKEHYEKEFEAICQKQGISEELRKALHKAIFYQRPLKSQKGLVGKCTFEKKKARCPISHPSFEEFRMWSFINNILVKGPKDAEKRPLSKEEITKISPLFFRKSKAYFDFEDIAKEIAGKKTICNYGKSNNEDATWWFNFSKETTVSGCPVSAGLKGVFGEDYASEICSLYTMAVGKSQEQIINDVWHALFSFDDDEMLAEWGMEKLQLSQDDAEKFAKISTPRDYASLSLNAINKILPFLRQGFRYDEAVFVANLKQVLPKEIYERESERAKIEQDIKELMIDFRNPLNEGKTKEQIIREYLQDRLPNITEKQLKRLYHPSMIENYPMARPGDDNIFKLGSPRIAAIKNPMAMRALFRLRALINQLLRDKKIDQNTKIRIEFARELNDANRRKAIADYQREREKDNKQYAEELKKLYQSETKQTIEPTDTDIEKYRLWEEQKHRCLYTGEQINVSDFVGTNPKFDIEHTIPRSMGGEDALYNKTLCEYRFNREIKKGQMPSKLSNHEEILARISEWEEKSEKLRKDVEFWKRRTKQATTKEGKDNAIARRHKLKMEQTYWQRKINSFKMKEAPKEFSNRQGVDIGIIGKYAMQYLKTVFIRVIPVKGATTADFRKMWGLQEEYTKKERVNHIHHCIDAITIACIGHNEYDRWARYMDDEERFERGEGVKPTFQKPWSTFTEDVKAVVNEVLISHHTPDNMAKQTKKCLRKRGKIQKNEEGKTIYVQGDTARASLHQQTFYGAIELNGERRYVVRKSLDALEEKDVKNIVDEVVREKVEAFVKIHGAKALKDAGNHTVWMNEEKHIPIRKVRIFMDSVKNPIVLKKQRDLSEKEYKQDYFVVNDSNYCMALYEGTDAKNKIKRNFRVVSNMEAAQYFKSSNDKSDNNLVPHSDDNNYPLKYILKPGTMVLFYEKTKDELLSCSSKEELTKRLYKVIGLSTQRVDKWMYGVINFRHHQEARQISSELKLKAGVWIRGEEYRPFVLLKHTQFNACVEGYDFDLTVTGEIKFKFE